MVPILKMRRFSCLLRLSLPPEMGEMAQIFISEIEWLAALKCRATGLSTSSLEMRTFFVERGYLLDSAIQKAFNNSRHDTLKPPLAKISDDKIPLVLTFHPFNYKVREVISRNFLILKNDLRRQPFSPITLLSLLDAIKTCEII